MIGVEIIEEAVEAAKENAERNGLHNCRFIAGDVFKVLDEIEEKPDVIVLDLSLIHIWFYQSKGDSIGFSGIYEESIPLPKRSR